MFKKVVLAFLISKKAPKLNLIVCARFSLSNLNKVSCQNDHKPIVAKHKLDTLQSDELIDLKSKYADPKHLIDIVVKDYIDVDRSKSPVLKIESHVYGYWKFSYKFKWPVCFSVEGNFKCKEDAIEYAYLKACEYLEKYGFIRNNELVDTESILFRDLVVAARLYNVISKPLQKTWKISAFKQTDDTSSLSSDAIRKLKGNKIWCCKVKLEWPIGFVVRSYGRTEAASIKNARLIAVYILNACGFIETASNQFQPARPKKIIIRTMQTYQERLIRKHDFEIYTDASPFGFGAFLIDMNNTNKKPVEYLCAQYPHDYIQYLGRLFSYGSSLNNYSRFDKSSSSETSANHYSKRSENFVRRMREPNRQIYRYFFFNDSETTEIYACVTSLYTWIRRMKKSRVLVYTDSAFVYHFVNRPRLVADNIQAWQDMLSHLETKTTRTNEEWEEDVKSLRKGLIARIFLILFEITQKNSIEFAAKLISNEENQEADALSRFLENQFAERLVARFNLVAAPTRTECRHLAIDWDLERRFEASTLQTFAFLQQQQHQKKATNY